MRLLEGGAAVAEQIRAITDAAAWHITATRQSVNVFGGSMVQGKGEDAAKRLLEDAFNAAGGRCIFGRDRVRTGPLAAIIYLEKADHPDHRHRRGRRL